MAFSSLLAEAWTTMRYTDRLVDAAIAPSVGSCGEAYDTPLAESVICREREPVDEFFSPPTALHCTSSHRLGTACRS